MNNSAAPMTSIKVEYIDTNLEKEILKIFIALKITKTLPIPENYILKALKTIITQSRKIIH